MEVTSLIYIHDIYRPFLTYFRRKRMRNFVRLMGVDHRTSIIERWRCAICMESH